MKNRDRKKLVSSFVGVVVGNAILAFGIAAFVLSNNIAVIGGTGIGVILEHYLGWDTSAVVLVINCILLVLGWIVIGKQFMLTTLLGSFLYPAFLSLFTSIPQLQNLTDNVLLATIFGGLLDGIGVGIVAHCGSSTGGTDTLAQILHKLIPLPLPVIMYGLNFVILLLQGLYSEPELVLYGILLTLIETITLNQVLLAGESKVQIYAFSPKSEAMQETLLNELQVGVTMFDIETGFGREPQKALMCVVPNRRLLAVKKKILEVDPKAFATVNKISDVSGQGFTRARIPYQQLHKTTT